MSTNDHRTRFEIYVPSPKSRINVGAPCPASETTGPFGFKGISMQSSMHLYMQATKHTVFQTGANYMGQANGQWRQFSKNPMYVASASPITLGSASRVIIVSGAGQAPIPQAAFGSAPRQTAYNELNLHYVTDTLQVGLFEFFHGRHERSEKTAGIIKKHQYEVFGSRTVTPRIPGGEKVKENTLKKKASSGSHEGGFLHTVTRSWAQMNGGKSEKDTTKVTADDINANSIVSPLISAEIALNDDTPQSEIDHVLTSKEKLEFGYAKYHARFDPYGYAAPHGAFDKLFKMVQTLKRQGHVLLKYCSEMLDFPGMKQAILLLEGTGAMVDAAYNVYLAGGTSWPALLTFADSDGNAGGYANELEQKFAGADSRPSGPIDQRKAVLMSPLPPNGAWELTPGTTYTLNVSWKGGSESEAVNINPTASSAAQLTLTAPQSGPVAESKTLIFQAGSKAPQATLTAANTVDANTFKAALSSAFTSAGLTGWPTLSVEGENVNIDASPTIQLIETGQREPTSTLEITMEQIERYFDMDQTRRQMSASDLSSWGLEELDIDLYINGIKEEVPFPEASQRESLHAVQRVFENTLRGKANVTLKSGTTDTLVITPLAVAFQLTRTGDALGLSTRMAVSEDELGLDTATITLAPPKLFPGAAALNLELQINGANFGPYALTTTNTLAALLQADTALQSAVTISGTGNGPITLVNRSKGHDKRIKVTSAAQEARWTFSPASKESTGTNLCNNPITVDELVGLIGTLDGVNSSKDGERVALESTEMGEGAKVEVSGNLADVVFTDGKQKVLGANTSSPSGTLATAEATDNIGRLLAWKATIAKKPAEVKSVLRPLSNAIDDTVAALTAVDTSVQKFREITGGGRPPAKVAIGLLATEGITLGTPDRIVGTGGRGVVFICDGGTGAPDRSKFLKGEGVLDGMTRWTKALVKPVEKVAKRSLGFRVLSDSAVDLTATVSASLKAMGRGTPVKARPDGRKSAGIGIASVIGSYAAEVAGYEKVVISARNPGKAKTGEHGGRVELLGRKLLIGGTAEDRPQLGIHSLNLDYVAGTDQLDEDSDVAWVNSPMDLAWSPELREKHPATHEVEIHGRESLDIRFRPFGIRVIGDACKANSKNIYHQLQAGIHIGKQPAPDADENLKRQVKQAEAGIDTVKTQLTRLVEKKAAKKKELKRVLGKKSQMTPIAHQYAGEYEVLKAEYRQIVAEEVKLKRKEKKATIVKKAITMVQKKFKKTTANTPLPMLELNEGSIRLGFVGGDNKWGKFPFIAITPEALCLFEPNASTKAPTLEIKKGEITIRTKEFMREVKTLNLQSTAAIYRVKKGVAVKSQSGVFKSKKIKIG